MAAQVHTYERAGHTEGAAGAPCGCSKRMGVGLKSEKTLDLIPRVTGRQEVSRKAEKGGGQLGGSQVSDGGSVTLQGVGGTVRMRRKLCRGWLGLGHPSAWPREGFRAAPALASHPLPICRAPARRPFQGAKGPSVGPWPHSHPGSVSSSHPGQASSPDRREKRRDPQIKKSLGRAFKNAIK